MEYISYNTGTHALPDIYALALGHHAYISGKALLPVLLLTIVSSEAKKKQHMRPLSELFTHSTALKFVNALAKPS